MTVDIAYYRRRALAEREMALSSERSEVAAIHLELARQYDALIARKELRPEAEVTTRTMANA